MTLTVDQIRANQEATAKGLPLPFPTSGPVSVDEQTKRDAAASAGFVSDSRQLTPEQVRANQEASQKGLPLPHPVPNPGSVVGSMSEAEQARQTGSVSRQLTADELRQNQEAKDRGQPLPFPNVGNAAVGLSPSEIKANQEAVNRGLPPVHILGTEDEKKAAKEKYDTAAKLLDEREKAAVINEKNPVPHPDTLENRLRAVESKVGIVPPGPINYDTVDGLPPRFVAGSLTAVNAKVK